jgi:N6-adenosine-specific RNA methylase IME4
MGKYSVILADPPWRFALWRATDKVGRGAGSANAYYQTMSTEEICALPVSDLAAKDCTLFLWATWPNLPDALRVLAAWGFTYKTCAFVWIKQLRSGWGLHMGLGYWTRANTEMCLLATLGHPKRIDKSVRQTVLAPLREHSRKPDEVHDKIVQLMGDVPRIELFARRRVTGWDSWGLEVESDISLDAIGDC